MDSEYYKINTTVKSQESVQDYFENDLSIKIDGKWPKYPPRLFPQANPQRNHLNRDEINRIKRIVRQAKKIRNKTGKGWKEIAKELGESQKQRFEDTDIIQNINS